MEQTYKPFKNAQTSLTDIEEKEEKDASIALGLVYDVENKRFHKVYKDLTTGRIRIEGDSNEADQELCMSISAA